MRNAERRSSATRSVIRAQRGEARPSIGRATKDEEFKGSKGLKRAQLPIYYGIGGRIKFIENRGHDNRVGIRIPVGINYLPGTIPLDFFFEIVPLLDLVPKTDFGVNGGIGFRYFF